MDEPLVSILLPVFDAEDTLPACLASIARQTETRWNCVIVDDGSRDGSRDVAREWVRRDGRFRLVSTSHRGVVAALSLGAMECSGRYVARMDADDLMRQDRLVWQSRALDAAPQLAAVGCHVRIFPRRELTEGMLLYEAWINAITSSDDVRRQAFVECPLVHPTLMIRRELLVEHGYRDCGWPEDYDLILRLLHGGHRVGVVPRRLLAWRDGKSRLSRRHERYSQPRFNDCKAEALAQGFLAGHQSYVLWCHGDSGRLLAQALLERGRRPSHIVGLDAGSEGSTIGGALVIPPDALPGVLPRKVLVSVTGEDARRRVRGALTEMGLAELRDYVLTA